MLRAPDLGGPTIRKTRRNPRTFLAQTLSSYLKFENDRKAQADSMEGGMMALMTAQPTLPFSLDARATTGGLAVSLSYTKEEGGRVFIHGKANSGGRRTRGLP